MCKGGKLIRVGLAVGLLTLAGALPARAAGVLDEILPHVTPAMGDELKKTEKLLEKTAGPKPRLPDQPVQALIDAIAALSSTLGFPQDPGPAVRAGNLPPDWAGHLALVVQRLHECHTTTTNHYRAIPPAQLREAVREDGDGAGLNPKDFNDIHACAERLWEVMSALEATLLTSSPTTPPGNIDVWPVLRFDTSGKTVYLNDYLLIVDRAGDDVYMNNIGSNMIDLNFSPLGSTVTGVRGTGAAAGCQEAVGGLQKGDCVPSAALLLDTVGNDTYGVKQTPDIDAQCTSDLVIRRMVVGGVGFLGAGLLVDSGGNDKYTGKTGSLGAGHVFGVGILDDRSGNDTYRSIRNSQGFSLIGDLGLLRDRAGNDSYDFYMPKALDPTAPNETLGAGGVIDDQGLCDNLPRFVQGGANVGGIGMLINDAGLDTYRGGFSEDFGAPGAPATTGRAGSQGFGTNGGIATFLDRAGQDSYTIVGNQGSPQRGNAVTIRPGEESTGPTGVFIDN